jgi:hypothetical protein
MRTSLLIAHRGNGISANKLPQPKTLWQCRHIAQPASMHGRIAVVPPGAAKKLNEAMGKAM